MIVSRVPSVARPSHRAFARAVRHDASGSPAGFFLLKLNREHGYVPADEDHPGGDRAEDEVLAFRLRAKRGGRGGGRGGGRVSRVRRGCARGGVRKTATTTTTTTRPIRATRRGGWTHRVDVVHLLRVNVRLRSARGRSGAGAAGEGGKGSSEVRREARARGTRPPRGQP
eukprot:31440-Pelagococcus_subviridis.AAC.33